MHNKGMVPLRFCKSDLFCLYILLCFVYIMVLDLCRLAIIGELITVGNVFVCVYRCMYMGVVARINIDIMDQNVTLYYTRLLCSLLTMLNIRDNTCNILLMVNKLFIILIGYMVRWVFVLL